MSVVQLLEKENKNLKEKKKKGNALENYRPITCLTLMWKLLTGVKAEEMYIILNKRNSCQKNKMDADEEAVEQRINKVLIRLC